MTGRRDPLAVPAAAGGAVEPSFDSPDVAGPEQLDRGSGPLRSRAARGLLINSAFRIGLAGVNLGRNLAVAAFLTPAEFGLWALIVTTIITFGFLKQIGVSSKYLQQNDPDQKLAFQKAFTVDLTYTALLCVLVAAALPIYAAIYGRTEIIVPGLVLSITLVASVFQAPLWVFYRRMEYFRQRVIEAIDPLLGAVVMITLAAAFDAGYWALVIGAVAGSLATAGVAVARSPYPLRIRFDRLALRQYAAFSWPVLVNGVGGLFVVQATLIAGNAELGLAALGAIGLATTFARFSARIEQLLNRTLYPPICAAQDRVEVLAEVFEKSNRLALMWAVPFGGALALFAPDLIRFVLGSQWEGAELLLQAAGVVFATQVFGFSWMSFYMARGETRPLAVMTAVQVSFFFVATLPLMLTVGLDGYVIGFSVAAAMQLAVRAHYLHRLFTGFSMASHLSRALLPVLPAVAVIAVGRALAGADRTLGLALGELGAYCGIVVAATWLSEQRLITEAVGYLRASVGSGRVRSEADVAA